ncbi:MAG: hypothetical protein MMC33_003068 [Icmadophila ericetorum]|nr:hypothetical protein [Icmadophila ericetorum]
MPRDPLIVILGATGTGKSQLAVALAERFHGEIINGDALQLYHGLPIATNKMSSQERKDIPHHLLGCMGLQDETWNVGKFEVRADEVIKDIGARGKLPILVGGTHYYTQSLLFKEYMIEKSEQQLSTQDEETKWPILAASGEEMLEELCKLDPVIASRWHPRDRRKIRRSLLLCLQSGRKVSDLYEEKLSEMPRMPTDSFSDGEVGGKEGPELLHSTDVRPALRYNTLLFWVHTEPEVLKTRLNERVDQMVNRGLLAEVQSMRLINQEQKALGRVVDTSRGIWAAIGYKEFNEYLAAKEQGVTGKELEKLKIDGLERTKAATRQYGKSQSRWIRLKLVPALRNAGVANNLFVLDSTDISAWTTQLQDPACKLTGDFLAGRLSSAPASLSPAAARLLDESGLEGDIAGKPCARVCEACEITTMTERAWKEHSNSRKHKVILKRARRGLDLEAKARELEIGKARRSSLEEAREPYIEKARES